MSDVRILLDRCYSAEELSDTSRDLSECFDERFNPVATGIPKDEYGFDKRLFRIQVTWIPDHED